MKHVDDHLPVDYCDGRIAGRLEYVYNEKVDGTTELRAGADPFGHAGADDKIKG